MDEPTHRGQKLDWKLTVNIICEKVPDPRIQFCYVCDLPIAIFGRMIPCKHALCYDCALRCEMKCARCDDKVQRVERCEPMQVFACGHGAPKFSKDACGRTYLSQRDLDAHIGHRHKPNPVEASPHNPQKRGNTNLITIPLKR